MSVGLHGRLQGQLYLFFFLTFTHWGYIAANLEVPVIKVTFNLIPCVVL
jgi:hypothetical protein